MKVRLRGFDGKTWDVEGSALRFKRLPQFTFTVHRAVNAPGFWSVSEATTGCHVAERIDRGDAIREATKSLSAIDAPELWSVIHRAVVTAIETGHAICVEAA